MIRAVDLNGDMGEYGDRGTRAVEEALMPLLTSCSIACGGHAGDDDTMRETVRLARRYGVGVGAHPSYPDREGFGRRSLALGEDELRSALQMQLADLGRVLDREGVPLRHLKPHGALYHIAAGSPALARLVVEVAAAGGSAVVILGPPGSALEEAAAQAGMAFAAEGFVDRRYRGDGTLVPRGEAGALIDDVAERAAQAVALAQGRPVPAVGGAARLAVATLCIHSDAPGAVETARAVRTALEGAGIAIRALG